MSGREQASATLAGLRFSTRQLPYANTRTFLHLRSPPKHIPPTHKQANREKCSRRDLKSNTCYRFKSTDMNATSGAPKYPYPSNISKGGENYRCCMVLRNQGVEGGGGWAGEAGGSQTGNGGNGAQLGNVPNFRQNLKVVQSFCLDLHQPEHTHTYFFSQVLTLVQTIFQWVSPFCTQNQ